MEFGLQKRYAHEVSIRLQRRYDLTSISTEEIRRAVEEILKAPHGASASVRFKDGMWKGRTVILAGSFPVPLTAYNEEGVPIPELCVEFFDVVRA